MLARWLAALLRSVPQSEAGGDRQEDMMLAALARWRVSC